MKIKTSELTGAALDWAVAKCEGREVSQGLCKEGAERQALIVVDGRWKAFHPSTDWAQGGPIIERKGINLRLHAGTDKQPIAFVWVNHQPAHRQYGPTPLIAAMRCYVASKLGDDIEIPEELK